MPRRNRSISPALEEKVRTLSIKRSSKDNEGKYHEESRGRSMIRDSFLPHDYNITHQNVGSRYLARKSRSPSPDDVTVEKDKLPIINIPKNFYTKSYEDNFDILSSREDTFVYSDTFFLPEDKPSSPKRRVPPAPRKVTKPSKERKGSSQVIKKLVF